MTREKWIVSLFEDVDKAIERMDILIDYGIPFTIHYPENRIQISVKIGEF